jgi:hypothetical protein
MAHAGEDVAQPPVAPTAAWLSLCITNLPQRSQVMRRNHDGKAANGSASASAGAGSGSVP